MWSLPREGHHPSRQGFRIREYLGKGSHSLPVKPIETLDNFQVCVSIDEMVYHEGSILLVAMIMIIANTSTPPERPMVRPQFRRSR